MRLIVHAAVLLGPASQSPSSPRRSTADRRFLVGRPLPEESKRQRLPETTHFCEPRLLSLFFINPFAPSFPSAAHSTSARRCLTCTSIRNHDWLPISKRHTTCHCAVPILCHGPLGSYLKTVSKCSSAAGSTIVHPTHMHTFVSKSQPRFVTTVICTE